MACCPGVIAKHKVIVVRILDGVRTYTNTASMVDLDMVDEPTRKFQRFI